MAITEHDLGPVRGDINDSVATFEQAGSRENIKSGDAGKKIFGKIQKWFADMTLSAFATIVNNATTTAANTVLDGRMGKTMMDLIDQLNRNFEFDISHASQNPVLQSALYIDTKNPYGDWNTPCVVTNSTINAPTNIAWGIREVLFVGTNNVILRITGVKYDGATTALWTRVLNDGNWSDGWDEH